MGYIPFSGRGTCLDLNGKNRQRGKNISYCSLPFLDFNFKETCSVTGDRHGDPIGPEKGLVLPKRLAYLELSGRVSGSMAMEVYIYEIHDRQWWQARRSRLRQLLPNPEFWEMKQLLTWEQLRPL